MIVEHIIQVEYALNLNTYTHIHWWTDIYVPTDKYTTHSHSHTKRERERESEREREREREKEKEIRPPKYEVVGSEDPSPPQTTHSLIFLGILCVFQGESDRRRRSFRLGFWDQNSHTHTRSVCSTRHFRRWELWCVNPHPSWVDTTKGQTPSLPPDMPNATHPLMCQPLPADLPPFPFQDNSSTGGF